MIRMSNITEFLKVQPFQPFRIHLSDGSHKDIVHPEMIKVTPSLVLFFWLKANQQPFVIDRWELLSMLHITRLEPIEVSPPRRK